MAEKWKPKDRIIYNGWINRIITEATELTEWEVEFIRSILKRFKNTNDNLTQPQAKVLEQIYANKTR